jgi:hypothetical protein
METELLRWSAWLNIFLFLMCIGGIIAGVFWGLAVGQRVGRGEPTTFFGGRVKGDAWQAPEPGGQNPGVPHQAGSTLKDPLAFLDEHINRNLKQMNSPRVEKTLLDPDLAGHAPTQAGRGGE